MKKLLFLTLLIVYSNVNAQYSGYYTVNQNVNANINENVNVSGNVNVNKNISTIDYGKLALANAENEKTRLENLKYADQQQKRISLEIASEHDIAPALDSLQKLKTDFVKLYDILWLVDKITIIIAVVFIKNWFNLKEMESS